MDAAKFYRHHPPSFGPSWLIYRLLLADAKLRRAINLGTHCWFVTCLTWVMILIVLVFLLAGTRATATIEKDFLTLRKETEKKIPRKKSVTDIRPAYNCIQKHLQQTDVFQEKTKKMIRKERLELEILGSRINCINKLLKPEAQSEWRRSKLPKVYYRFINSSK
ncbi:uncharacterized protein LOC122399660 [Colletes gigas]|uniref:uncharacterized protein LOC122399660 n=1 Tax=Colletes gigas TaxID=935657 RepID=UPI001C9B41E6|nr:uncharacterized protein LOC122399660 [Colletes gigas]